MGNNKRLQPCGELLKDIVVVAVDVGRGFGWYACREGICEELEGKNLKSIDDLINFVRNSKDKKIALGFEAPLFLPLWKPGKGLVPREPFETQQNAWYKDFAGVASAKAIPILHKVFSDLKEFLKKRKITFSVDEFLNGDADFLIWEAWVSKCRTLGNEDLFTYLRISPPSAPEEYDEHVRDAFSAAFAFSKYLFGNSECVWEEARNRLDPEEIRKCWNGQCFNIAASQLFWAGVLEHEEAQRMLRCACPVVKARKL